MERTLGQFPRGKINYTSTLADHVRDVLTDKHELQREKNQVKLGGDGARRPIQQTSCCFHLHCCKNQMSCHQRVATQWLL